MARYVIPANFVSRTDLKQEVKNYRLNLADAKVHDALLTALPTTSANDDLGLTLGTFGSSHPLIQTSDLKTAGSTARYARFIFVLPPEYDGGETVTLRINCGMTTTVADTSCTIDASAYSYDGDGTVSADLVSTAATSMNSLTAASKDFTVTATSLSPGDTLDIRLLVTCNDAAGGTAVIATIYYVDLLLDVRG